MWKITEMLKRQENTNPNRINDNCIRLHSFHNHLQTLESKQIKSYLGLIIKYRFQINHLKIYSQQKINVY